MIGLALYIQRRYTGLMADPRIEWDPRKAVANRQKPGVIRIISARKADRSERAQYGAS